MEEYRAFMEEKRDFCFKMGKLYSVGCGLFLELDLVIMLGLGLWGILGVILFIAGFVTLICWYYTDISKPFADKYGKLWSNSVKPSMGSYVFTMVISAVLFLIVEVFLLVLHLVLHWFDLAYMRTMIGIAFAAGLLIQVISRSRGLMTARRVYEDSLSKGRITLNVAVSAVLAVLTTAPMALLIIIFSDWL